jgi:hypothetical protein
MPRSNTIAERQAARTGACPAWRGRCRWRGALLLVSLPVHGQDMAWPQFRGVESNPVGTHERLAERWSKTENVAGGHRQRSEVRDQKSDKTAPFRVRSCNFVDRSRSWIKDDPRNNTKHHEPPTRYPHFRREVRPTGR